MRNLCCSFAQCMQTTHDNDLICIFGDNRLFFIGEFDGHVFGTICFHKNNIRLFAYLQIRLFGKSFDFSSFGNACMNISLFLQNGHDFRPIIRKNGIFLPEHMGRGGHKNLFPFGTIFFCKFSDEGGLSPCSHKCLNHNILLTLCFSDAGWPPERPPQCISLYRRW